MKFCILYFKIYSTVHLLDAFFLKNNNEVVTDRIYILIVHEY